MAKKNNTIILAAGGTGGHIFPAQALCSILLKHRYKPLLICDERTEKFLQKPLSDIEKYQIISTKFSGSIVNKLASFFLLIFSSILVLFKLVRSRPKAIIGFGGYPSFPTLLAATILRIPFFIHEQNAVLGRVNKIFARFASKVFLTFPNTKFASKKNSILTGNFVRQEILAAKSTNKKAEKIYILIIGGSQGAQILSEVIPATICSLPQSLQKKLVIHQQARPNLIDSTKLFYKKCPAKVEVKDFFLNIGELLKQADLVICRAGASTIAELTALGKPAIFIPYKHAKDNHQFYNAKHLVENGAAISIEEDKLNTKDLQIDILRLLNKPQTLYTMGKAAKNLGKVNDSKTVLGEIDKI